MPKKSKFVEEGAEVSDDEGQQRRTTTNTFDDDEDSETDDHVPNTYADDGFIVNDDEDEEDEEEQQQQQQHSRSRHHDSSHKRRRSESDNEDDDDDDHHHHGHSDDDDDGGGGDDMSSSSNKKKKRKHRLKRLKKKNKLDRELEELTRNDDDDDELGGGGLSDDDNHHHHYNDHMYDEEEDEDDDGGDEYGGRGGGRRGDIGGGNRHKSRASGGHRRSSQMGYDDDDMRSFIVGRSKRDDEYDDDDLFGSGRYYGDEEENVPAVSDRESLQKIFSPDEIAEQFMTDADEVIRNEDIPERYQLSKTVRDVTEAELAEEANWIYEQAFDYMEIGAFYDSVEFTNDNHGYNNNGGGDMMKHNAYEDNGGWGQMSSSSSSMGGGGDNGGGWGSEVTTSSGGDFGGWGQEFSDNNNSNNNTDNGDQGNWGQELSQYDGMDDIAHSTSSLLKEKVIDEIRQVLQFMLLKRPDQLSRFDIPYIAQYKKEYVATNLKYDDLWTIYEYDQKWCNLKAKQNTVKDLYRGSTMNGIDFYQSLMKQAATVEDVEDMITHYQLYNAPPVPDKPERKVRKSSRKDTYAIAKQSNVAQFALQFSLSPMQYAENVSLSFAMHKKEDPSEAPATKAQQFVSTAYRTSDEVLRVARSILAREISAEPYIRYVVRQAYKTYAQISLAFTPKGETSSAMRLRDYKNVRNTSLSSFSRASELIQLMHIFRDERDGLVQVTITIPDERLNEALRHDELYLSTESSPHSQAWNEQRSRIIQEVKRHLIPTMENFIRSYYSKKGKAVVARACKHSLERVLIQGPFGHDKHHNPNLMEVLDPDEEDENPRPTRHRIMSCCVGIDREVTTFTVLDTDGQFVGELQWKYNVLGRISDETKKFAEEQEQSLMRFIEQHQPHALAVATTGLNALKLFKVVEDIVNELNMKRRIRCKGVFYVSDKFARIYEVSNMADREFQGSTPIQKRSVFVARYFNDPLTALANLFNNDHDITCYKFHELQDILSQEHLLTALEQAFVTVVNAVGVDINRIVNAKHLQSVLRFVSGLGPRKADKLIKAIQGRKKPYLMNRRQLVDSIEKNGVNVGKVVFFSCAGFIRIVLPPGIKPDRDFDALDNTRIHPENYKLAIKIAMDALDMEDEDDECIEKVMRNSKKLEDLDLVSYAEELEKRGLGKRHSTLQDIKTELQDPFKDPRDDFINMALEDPRSIDLLFSCITGETDKTLHVDQLVSTHVQREAFGKSGQWIGFNCQLDNGLRAFLHQENINTSKEITVGSMIDCTIKEIDKKGFYVKLACNDSEINQAKEALVVNPVLPRSTHRPSSSSTDSASRSSSTQKRSRRQYKRSIQHPNFRNFSYGEAIEFLADKPEGESVIRPSSLGPDHLAVTFKYLNGQYMNLDIKEEDKIDINSLGRRLKIKDKTYSDIDEILVNYVQHFIDFAKKIETHHKYSAEDPESIERGLVIEKQRNPKSIPYRIGINPKSSGRFIIYFMPNKRVKKQHISVVPEGYVFNQRTFTNITKLLNAFKTAFQATQMSK